MPLINRINKNKKKQSISSNNINSIKNSSQVNKNRLKERILQRLQKQRERNRKIQEEQLNQQLQQKKEKAREREQLKQKNRKIRTIASQSSSKTSTQKPKFFSQKPKPKSKPLKSLMTHAQKKKLSKKPILTKEQPNAKVIEFKPDYAVSQRKQHSKQSQQKVIRPKKPINVHNLTKKQIIHLSLERRNSLYQQIEEKATQIKQKLRQLQVNKQPLPFELVKELHTSNNVLKYINGIKESEIQAREQQMLKEGTYNQTIKANAEENKSSSQSSQILTTSKEKALKQKSKTNTTKEFLKKSYEERFCEKIGEKGKERLNSLVKKWQNNYGINISRHTKEYSKINEIRKMLEKVESAHKANFLYYGVAKVLELKPSVEQFKSYGLELIKMLEKFESRYKANFLYYGVAKVLELKPSLEHLQEITKMLEKVESAHSLSFLKNGVKYILELKPSLEQFKLYGLELTKMLEKVESAHKANFLYYGVAKVLELKPSVEQFKLYGLELTKLLEKVESANKPVFLIYGIAKLLALKPSLEHFQEITKMLEKVESRYKDNFLRNGIVKLLELNPSLEHFQELSSKFIRLLDKNKSPEFNSKIIDVFSNIIPSFDLKTKNYYNIFSFLESQSINNIQNTNANLLSYFLETLLKENISVIDSINNFNILKKEITSVLEKEKINNVSEIFKDFTYSDVSDYYQKVVDLIKNKNLQDPKLRELLTRLNKLKTISQEEISKANERLAITQKNFNVFYNKLAKGERISAEDGIFYETLLRSEYKRFNPDNQNYLEDLQELAKKLKINTKQSSQAILREINQKLPEYNPEIKIIAPETKYSQHDFITKAIELNVPEQTLVDLRENLSRTTTIQEETINNIKQEIKKVEITVKKALEKKEYIQLFEKYPELERMKKGIEKGGVPAENLINFIFKNKEIPSEMITDIIKNVFKSEYPEVFERFVTNSMDTNAKNQFLTKCKELDIPLEDYLLNNGLTGIFNKVKASDTYQKIVDIRKAVSEVETKSKGITSNLEITFSEHRELLDAFSGVFSGTCFGDYPYNMLRKELFMEKVFKDGNFVGGLTNIIREVEGKKTLVIVGVDVSKAFVSGLSLSKKQELINLMIDRQKDFCKKNNLNIAISPVGGISNRDGFVDYITYKYISDKKHNIAQIKIHPGQNYKITECFDLK